MKHSAILLLLFPLAPLALGQAVPAGRGPAFYTGFHLPDVSGSLRFSVSAAQRLRLGTSNQSLNGDSFDISGNAGYLSASPTHPFSMVYSGGYFYQESGNLPGLVFQRLALSQVLDPGRWKFVVSDSVNYLPETPATGLSGIPGVGDINVPPVTTSPDAFTNYAERVTNDVSGTVQRQLTGATSISGTGSQSIIRYINAPVGTGIESNGYSGLGSISHEFDARTSASIRYVYSNFNYLDFNYGITTQMVAVQIQRQLSRQLTVSGFIGPQHISSSDPTLVPARTNVSADASLSYVTPELTTSLSFATGANSGGGLVTGATTTSIRLLASKQFGRDWHASVDGGYIKYDSLIIGAFNSQSVIVGAQANRKLLQYLSAYISYTMQHQLNSGSSIPSLALNGYIQSLSFGITYAPNPIYLSH